MRVIAIDGPAGSGKTTIAKALAARLGLEYLNTGAMYRAVALAVLRAGGDPADEAFAIAVARNARICVEGDKVTVDGVDATAAVRSSDVTQSVSAVAAIAGVREELVAAQRAWAQSAAAGCLKDATSALWCSQMPRSRPTSPFIPQKVHDDGLCRKASAIRRKASAIRTDSMPTIPSLILLGYQMRTRIFWLMCTRVLWEAVAADLARRNHADTTRHCRPVEG